MSEDPVPDPRRPGFLEVTMVDHHAGGEPFRIVTGGVPAIPGATILDKLDPADPIGTRFLLR